MFELSKLPVFPLVDCNTTTTVSATPDMFLQLPDVSSTDNVYESDGDMRNL